MFKFLKRRIGPLLAILIPASVVFTMVSHYGLYSYILKVHVPRRQDIQNGILDGALKGTGTLLDGKEC